jgi:hypothetical protein
VAAPNIDPTNTTLEPMPRLGVSFHETHHCSHSSSSNIHVAYLDAAMTNEMAIEKVVNPLESQANPSASIDDKVSESLDTDQHPDVDVAMLSSLQTNHILSGVELLEKPTSLQADLHDYQVSCEA